VGDQLRRHGIGIEKEFAEKVFVIFQRLHPGRRTPAPESARHREEDREYHGGTIWIDTTYADGAAIRFTLPSAS